MERQIQAEAIYLAEDSGLTLQGRLMAALVRLILDRRYPPGTRLPSSRKLATHLGVSRLTVTLVYQELAAQGYIDSLPRSGYLVAACVPHRRLTMPKAPSGNTAVDWDSWLTNAPHRQRVIRKPDDWQNYRYGFIFGQPDPTLFDLGAWRDCVRMSMGRREFGDLAIDRYGRDDPMLVDFICANTLPRRGILAQPENVLITMGAQNALFMAIDLLAAPDRLAVMEEPGYPDLAETLRRAVCPVHFQPIGPQGLNPAELPHETRLVVVTPSHNIPTGVTMPLAPRRELLRLADKRDFLIVEDDYDFEMSYLAPPEPALKSLDRDDRVIYIGSFSKSMFPSMRIGYMVGPAPLIAAARELRTIMLRHAPAHLQRATAYFLARGCYDAHIVNLRRAFRARRAAIIEALESAPGLSIAGTAMKGGTSIWVGGPEGVDSQELGHALSKQSVLIEPGAAFFAHPETPCRHFRLGYSSISEQLIPEGIQRIARQAAVMPRRRT